MSEEVAVVGAGPAGLMAAGIIAAAGHQVTIFESRPSAARKLLLAGKSGLNITHSEPHRQFRSRFGVASRPLAPALDAFTSADVRAWAEQLGTETFTGSSGRVFPKAMKASPLLRAWLRRLDGQGVRLLTRHRWAGFAGDALVFDTPDGRVTKTFDAVVLALGGASWPRLGSDAAWVPWLRDKGVPVTPLRPANCGFDVDWSAVFAERFAGTPVKTVTASSALGALPGEFVVTDAGIEGSLVYAHAAALRDTLEQTGKAILLLDLAPGRAAQRLEVDLTRQGPKQSLSNRLRKGAGLDAIKAALVRELAPAASSMTPAQLAATIKTLPLPVLRPRPIAEAISSAGGIAWDAIDKNYMLKALPGMFAAGEMLDWEAPTGGYLLTACLATGRAAGQGALDWLAKR